MRKKSTIALQNKLSTPSASTSMLPRKSTLKNTLMPQNQMVNMRRVNFARGGSTRTVLSVKEHQLIRRDSKAKSPFTYKSNRNINMDEDGFPTPAPTKSDESWFTKLDWTDEKKF